MSPEEMLALHILNAEAIRNGKPWAYRTALSGIRQYNDTMRAIADVLPEQLARILPGPEKRQENTNG